MTDDADRPDDGEAPGDAGVPEEKAVERRIAWGYIGGAALIVVAILLGIWALWNAQQPAPAATDSPASSATPGTPAAVPTVSGASTATAAPTDGAGSNDAATPPAQADAAAPTIAEFSSAQAEAACADERDTVALSFSWRVEGADDVRLGVGTTAADAQGSAPVDPEANGYPAPVFDCRLSEQLYTLTASNAGGATSSTIVVMRVMGGR